MDKKYESNYQRRDGTKAPSYDPLQVADRSCCNTSSLQCTAASGNFKQAI